MDIENAIKKRGWRPLSEYLTRIAASCESRGQSNEVERRLEAAREDGAQALVLLGDIGAGKEAREYAKVLRTVGPSAAIRFLYEYCREP